jgi:ParB/RepB/Spo0J family partition protein
MSKKTLKDAMHKSAALAARSSAGSASALDEVLGATPSAVPAPAKILPGARLVPLNQVEPDPKQPRRTMDQEALRDLADSIRENGVLQPITVRWNPAARVYRVITGHRRAAAARPAKLDAIPAIVQAENYDERRTLQHQLVENIQREGIPPVEEARALQALIDAQGLSQHGVAKRLGKQVIYVNELLTILKIEAALLAKATHLPKRVLVEIGRGKNRLDQERLLAAALSSSSPHAEVRRARQTKKKATLPRSIRSFRVEEQRATVTVSFAKPDDQVSLDDISSALTKVLRRITDEREAQRPRRTAGR